MAATYTKLKSGDWGVRVEGGNAPTAGAKITVVKKSGESKVETIAKVVWSGNGVHLCAIGQQVASYTPKAGKSRGSSDMSGRCWECGGGMPGWLAAKGEECGNC